MSRPTYEELEKEVQTLRAKLASKKFTSTVLREDLKEKLGKSSWQHDYRVKYKECILEGRSPQDANRVAFGYANSRNTADKLGIY